MRGKFLFSIAILPLLFISLFDIDFNRGEPAEPEEVHHSLIAHEWGTFTTLHGSDGVRLYGLEAAEEVLPAFVYNHSQPDANSKLLQPIFAPNLVQNLKGGPPIQLNTQLLADASPMNVSVKMETPVIYFHSAVEREVEVTARFPNGSINEWYPQRTKGENHLVNHDFTKPYEGWINWKAKILSPESTQPLSPPADQESPIWISPRTGKANNVEVNGEVENFLFYRGMANFDIPLHVEFNKDRELYLRNKGMEEIPFSFVYEKTKAGEVKFWWFGQIESKAEKILDLSCGNQASAFSLRGFEMVLEKAGLFKEEAEAMVRTWKNSYFEKPGFRVFWIAPEKFIERTLPLEISPRPDEVKRVFVGRCDVITPAFEKVLLGSNDVEMEKLKADRYYTGYCQRVEALKASKSPIGQPANMGSAQVGWSAK